MSNSPEKVHITLRDLRNRNKRILGLPALQDSPKPVTNYYLASNNITGTGSRFPALRTLRVPLSQSLGFGTVGRCKALIFKGKIRLKKTVPRGTWLLLSNCSRRAESVFGN